MINELVSDYSEYVRVDLEQELHDVQDTIDDMLTRLDEFENLVNMVKTDNELCSNTSIPLIIQSKQKLDLLFSQVDSLERFVNHIKSNVDIVEAKVLAAEEEMGQNNRSFKKMFKPLFSKISPSSASNQRTMRTTYESPVLFSTAEFFSSECNNDNVQKDQKS